LESSGECLGDGDLSGLLDVDAEDGPVEAEPSGAPLAYLEPLRFDAPRGVSSINEQATELLSSDEGALAMTTPYGRGRVVLVGSADPFTNASLALGGGALYARLLRAFASPRPVLFDE